MIRFTSAMTMRELATFSMILCVSLIACADDCSLQSIHLYSDQDFDMQVFFDNTPARSTTLQLYSGDRLVRNAIADHDGRVRLGILPDGKYRVVIPRNGSLDLMVLPQKSSLNGPLIIWSLFPKSKFKWVDGKKVAGRPCPTFVIKED